MSCAAGGNIELITHQIGALPRLLRHQAAVALLKASDTTSETSAPSSLRTEKSLGRQKEWEADHARVRARRLRERMIAGFEKELQVRIFACQSFVFPPGPSFTPLQHRRRHVFQNIVKTPCLQNRRGVGHRPKSHAARLSLVAFGCFGLS